MNASEFTAGAPGRLVEIAGGHAFVPNQLPPNIAPSWELASALEGAALSLARLVGQASLIGNRDLLIRPLITREAVESNRLEGTHTQIGDVLLEEAKGPPRDPGYAADLFEVRRYLEATALGEGWVADGRPITVHLFRALHKELLSGTRGAALRLGEFRHSQVLIGQHGDSPAEARFVPPPFEHVEGAIADLVRFIEDDDQYPPLVASAICHYQFETIHPFEDGNGRLGRLLIPLQLMRRHVIDSPLVNLSPYFEARRTTYLGLLKDVSCAGMWSEWVIFFLDAVRSQAEDARRRAAVILELRSNYLSIAREHSRSQSAVVAIDFLMERVYLTASDLSAYARCTYKTARSAIEVLAQHHVVEAVPDTYPQLWVARELLDQVYK